MRRWPVPTVDERLEALPRWAVVAAIVTVLLVSAKFALDIPGFDIPVRLPVADEQSATDALAPDPAEAPWIEIPAAALTATLFDELFPTISDAPVAKPDPPLARLDVVLIAISSMPAMSELALSEPSRTAFLRVPATNEYLALTIGQRTPGGAEVCAIDAGGVLFVLGDRQARLELGP